MPTVSVEATGFQPASTALTVTVNALPEVRALGVPVLPEALPGAAVSPGSRIWSFVNAPALIVVAGLVSGLLEPSVWSVALTVEEPAVVRMIAKVFVPATSAAGAGGVALPSLVLSATVSVELTGFQFASTAFTVTLTEEPAVCAEGLPVLPEDVPGAAVSPGSRICSLLKVPALIVVEGLVLAVFEPSVISVEVTVAVPAVFAVTAKVLVPATSAALAGSVALASVEVMPTVSVELTRFQFASTAFTVTLNDEPAVCAEELPVLPVALPGAAVSPGSRICSWVKAPALIVVEGLVLAVLAPSVMSVEVTVAVPAVFAVTAKVLVPATSAAFAGRVAFASFEVMPT